MKILRIKYYPHKKRELNGDIPIGMMSFSVFFVCFVFGFVCHSRNRELYSMGFAQRVNAYLYTFGAEERELDGDGGGGVMGRKKS